MRSFFCVLPAHFPLQNLRVLAGDVIVIKVLHHICPAGLFHFGVFRLRHLDALADTAGKVLRITGGKGKSVACLDPIQIDLGIFKDHRKTGSLYVEEAQAALFGEQRQVGGLIKFCQIPIILSSKTQQMVL